MTESINHPPHYGGDSHYEAIKVIEAWNLGFHTGNVLKYICRAAYKGNQIDDLKKAAWYLQRRIDQLELRARVQNLRQGSTLHHAPL